MLPLFENDIFESCYIVLNYLLRYICISCFILRLYNNSACLSKLESRFSFISRRHYFSPVSLFSLLTYVWLSDKVKHCAEDDRQYTSSLSNTFTIIFLCNHLSFLNVARRHPEIEKCCSVSEIMFFSTTTVYKKIMLTFFNSVQSTKQQIVTGVPDFYTLEIKNACFTN